MFLRDVLISVGDREETPGSVTLRLSLGRSDSELMVSSEFGSWGRGVEVALLLVYFRGLSCDRSASVEFGF